MPTLSDSIERYLKGRLSRAVEGVIEIRRSEVAEQFDCVPSQINYVLQTRFTPQRGYYVESRRGGGGYIRIMRLYVRRSPVTWDSVCEEIGDRACAERAEAIINRLVEIGRINARQATLIRAPCATRLRGWSRLGTRSSGPNSSARCCCWCFTRRGRAYAF